jgi:hypothetical protein
MLDPRTELLHEASGNSSVLGSNITKVSGNSSVLGSNITHVDLRLSQQMYVTLTTFYSFDRDIVNFKFHHAFQHFYSFFFFYRSVQFRVGSYDIAVLNELKTCNLQIAN